MFILAQIFRVISSFFGIMADKASDSKKVLLYNGIYNFFSALQYFFLFAFSGAISSIVAIGRNVIFYKFPKKVPIYILIIYFVVIVALNIPAFDGLISFIPVLLVVMYTTALYIGNIYGIKYTVLVICVLESFYDYYCKAYIGIGVCILDFIIVSVSLYKMKHDKSVLISE